MAAARRIAKLADDTKLVPDPLNLNVHAAVAAAVRDAARSGTR